MSIDSMPCTLFKQIIPAVVPFIHTILNLSLQTGVFPSTLKISIITPILKSSNLDTDILNHYRPVSSLSILSKIFEKTVLIQLTNHLNINNLFAQHQSAYRPHHSCETAITKVIDDILSDMASDSFVMISFLDFSAAFDTVDHEILINRLYTTYNI